MGRVCREYSSPARQCLGECKRADFVLFNSAEDTCAQPVPGPVVSRGVKMCFTAAGLQHPLHPPKNDPFCYDEKLSTMQVKTLQMNLGREQGCLDARAATAFAGRKVLKKKKKMQLYSAFLMRKLRLSGCRGDGKASTSLANPLNSLDQRLKCI